MWFLLTLSDLALIALGFIIAAQSNWLWPVSILIIGIGQHRLALMAHDASHGHAPRIVSRGTFALLMVGLDGYQRHHSVHHHFVGMPGDSERRVTEPLHHEWYRSRWVRLKRYFFTDSLGFGAINIWRLLKEFWRRASVFDALVVALVWSSIIAATIVLHSLWGLWLWVSAITSVFWAVFRQRMLTEHVGCVVSHPTRTYHASWWEKILYLPHNTDLHKEHHNNPGIPCWKLARVI